MNSTHHPRPVHVERTPDPAVLRWVCHHPSLAPATPEIRRPKPDSRLGSLMADGSISEIVVAGGDIRIRAVCADSWPLLAPQVQAALLLELDSLDERPRHWLTDPVSDTPTAPSALEIQQIVNEAATSVLASHGGAMTVTAVDETTVWLRADGACHGCLYSRDTIVGLIEPALRSAHPEITQINVDLGPEKYSRPARKRLRSSINLKIRNGNRTCH